MPSPLGEAVLAGVLVSLINRGITYWLEQCYGGVRHHHSESVEDGSSSSSSSIGGTLDAAFHGLH
jgi:hypothetical protein